MGNFSPPPQPAPPPPPLPPPPHKFIMTSKESVTAEAGGNKYNKSCKYTIEADRDVINKVVEERSKQEVKQMKIALFSPVSLRE